MARSIFVNLPVASVDESVEFFTTLGFEFDRQFTDNRHRWEVIWMDPSRVQR